MSQNVFRGVFTIPSTPFDENGAIDWTDLKRVIDFCVDCSAHGIVWPVNASGFPVLTDEERLTGMQVVVEQTAGRIPVVLGVQGLSAQHAAMFSLRAQEVGADAVIAMAPYVQELEDEGAVLRYYRAIDGEVEVPIFIQNHTRGSVFSIETMVRLIQEVGHVEYIKEETVPTTIKLTGVLEGNDGSCKGVFGGAGGRYLIEEHRRGSSGNMPGCHVTDVVVAFWNALEAGDEARAMYIYKEMAPLFFFEHQLPGCYKEVLYRRGVIGCPLKRNGAMALDGISSGYLDDILKALEPLMTWGK